MTSPLLTISPRVSSSASLSIKASTTLDALPPRDSCCASPLLSRNSCDSHSFENVHPDPAAMRLFLIPISTRRALIYARPLRKDIAKELSLLDRTTSKAAQIWAGWEEAESGWKKHLVTWGNRVQQRIPFEEWGLKSIPSLASQQRVDKDHGKKKIEVLFPGNSVRLEKIPTILRSIATERQEFHRKKMIWSFGFAPITAPLGLIPVYDSPEFLKPLTISYTDKAVHRVPNIPFFYLVYRGWSHWRG